MANILQDRCALEIIEIRIFLIKRHHQPTPLVVPSKSGGPDGGDEFTDAARVLIGSPHQGGELVNRPFKRHFVRLEPWVGTGL